MKAVLFDLDGTLIDTAADLLGTLDDLRAEMGLAPCAANLPPAVAARGGRGILALGFPGDPEIAERLLPRYLERYSQRLSKLSRPYVGVLEMLDELDARGLKYAIVSNKPEKLARQLLIELGWNERFAVLVGGDTLSVRKPAAEPVLHACAALGVVPEDCVMVGDDERDVLAGRAAGCAYTIAAAYGYLEAPQQVAAWGADRIVHSAPELAAVLAGW